MKGTARHKEPMPGERGFTLLELMIVVLTIGLLAAMVVPRLTGRIEAARRAAAGADIRANIALALDLYEVDNGAYPTTDQGLRALIAEPTTPPAPRSWNGPYIKGAVPRDPWGNPYVYVCPGQRNTWGYDLSSHGADGQEGGGDDIANWETEGEEKQ